MYRQLDNEALTIEARHNQVLKEFTMKEKELDIEMEKIKIHGKELEKMGSQEYIESEKNKMHYELHKQHMENQGNVLQQLTKGITVKRKITTDGVIWDSSDETESVQVPFEKLSKVHLQSLGLGVQYDDGGHIKGIERDVENNKEDEN